MERIGFAALLILGGIGCTKSVHIPFDEMSQHRRYEPVGIILTNGEEIDCNELGCLYDPILKEVSGVIDDGTRFSRNLDEIAFVKCVRAGAESSIPDTVSPSGLMENYDFEKEPGEYKVTSVTLKSGGRIDLGKGYDKIDFRQRHIAGLSPAGQPVQIGFDDIHSIVI